MNVPFALVQSMAKVDATVTPKRHVRRRRAVVCQLSGAAAVSKHRRFVRFVVVGTASDFWW
jgi:hypothetical protein